MMYLQHYRARIALHTLKESAGPKLLLLHALGERSPSEAPEEYGAWPGSIFALDFVGHGASTLPTGGGYSCENLAADADSALAQLGKATVAGRGLGAYVALLIAGGRPERVRGAILRDGSGLAGGGPVAGSPFIPFVDSSQAAPPDPWALIELATDVRPADYASVFARQAARYSGLDRPLSICAGERPAWLEAIVREPGVCVTTLAEALDRYSRA